MTPRRIMVETEWLTRLGNGIERMLKGMEIDRPDMEQRLQELRGVVREDRTSFSPEAIEAAAIALGGVLLIPDPTNTETTTLIMDAVEAAIRAFITVQYGIENNEAD